jgi:hypothetical protein
MSLYRLNKIMFLLDVDQEFLTSMRADAAATVRNMDLTDEERTAFLTGDVGKLYLMGVDMFLLDTMVRHELFGIDRAKYLERVRAAAEQAGKGTL